MASNERGDGFYGLPETDQIRRLGELAHASLARWDLASASIEPAAYRENMTFRIDAGRRGRFALRIHQAGYRSDANIVSELAFMQALGEQGVRTPEVVPAGDGSLFVVAEGAGVPEPRQCDLFEWIDGRPLRATGDDAPHDTQSLATTYRELGRQAAAIANAAESWPRPPGFSRPAWDAEGIFGESAHLGDFRTLDGVTAEQRTLHGRLAEKLTDELGRFGKTPDRFGLSHGDFLPENIMVCADGIRLIDFDDCGEGWYLFDFATAVFDLLGGPAFDACVEAMTAGYRDRRTLPDEHLAFLPMFLLARALSYLGWSASRSHLEKARQIAPMLLAAVDAFGPVYLASDP